MIKVHLSTNTDRRDYTVSPSATIRSFLEEHNVDYGGRSVNLDGTTLRAGDFDTTFEEYGIGESCYITSIAKVDNA